MLDTVPKTVQLTEIIEPLPVKPQDISLVYMGDGTFHLTGQVRVRASDHILSCGCSLLLHLIVLGHGLQRLAHH